MAFLARAKARIDALTNRRIERAVLRLWLARRTGQPTEHTGCRDAHIRLPVIGGVAVQQRFEERVVIWKIE